MEWATNGDLFQYVQKNDMTEAEKLEIFRQVCEAVKYMHSLNIIHRDIKPENILLDEEMNVKLSDFGWSCIYSKSSTWSSFSGTLEYMAPEVQEQKI